MNIPTYDVVIIGGGLIGLTQAIALGDSGVRSCIIDKTDPSLGLKIDFDGRTSAIAYSSKVMLEQIGVWRNLKNSPGSILDIRISDSDSSHHLHFNHKSVGNKPFGFMVENKDLRYALLKRIHDLKNITLIAPQRITKLIPSTNTYSVLLENKKLIKTPLIIGADGRNSFARESAEIGLTKWPYKQSAIVFSISHEYSHNFIAHERFLKNGPLAILPLKNKKGKTGTHSSIVWTEDKKIAKILMQASNEEFKKELEIRIEGFLGKINIIGQKWCYPLSFQFAETSISERLALVGDASHGLHPIAGQGLNMGLRDISALAEVIVNAKRLGLDIGTKSVLNDYYRWRHFDNTLMLASTDFLNHLFSTNIKPIAFARRLGLTAVNKILPLKKILMKEAMGLTGELPRLMRGENL